VTYKTSGSRKKRLACAQEIKCFYFFSLYQFSSLLVSHTRASRFFRSAIPATVETAGGKRKGGRGAGSLKPLFPQYLIGTYAWRRSGG
jgi:hypothetical protein